jgi:hypothetical protein
MASTRKVSKPKSKGARARAKPTKQAAPRAAAKAKKPAKAPAKKPSTSARQAKKPAAKTAARAKRPTTQRVKPAAAASTDAPATTLTGYPPALKQPAGKPHAAKPHARGAPAPKSPPAVPNISRAARGKHGALGAHELAKAVDGGAVESMIVVESSDAVPSMIAGDSTEARRMLTARDRMTRSLPVLEILEDEHPIGALRRFLETIRGQATPQQAQIVLGSAQLMLLPSAREHERGTPEVRELVDLVLRHWEDFGERRRGFHAQEFLRNALVAIGVDRDRTARLEELVPPHPTNELLFSLACAHAVSRDKVAMLRAVERALEAGASPTDFRREADFAPYANDPDLSIILSRAEVPPIPVDIDPYLPGVRAALDSLLSTLKEFGESVELRPGVRLDAILDAERAGKISLPNDYRALLTLTNGMRLWEHEFFGAGDYREHTKLATRAHHYLESSFGVTGLVECVPVANWGQPDDWLLYDPRGRLRGGEAGYVLRAGDVEEPVEDLAAALVRMEHLAREVLGTN